MSNQSQGAVLAGQPVAVTAGSGITIDPNTGVISVNASTITGVMKLNSGSAYNAYQWPNSPGTNGQFLQTNGAGLVDWADVQGFAVVSVQSGAPSPADIGELWFDCDTGTLNVYQNCVGTPSPNWFNVAQPGFPVLPANTSSDVAWTGSGTQASPYQMTVTTTGSGSAVQILNTVTINGLAPFQYVPIVDLNAVANGGRFSFTNNYADSSGQLIFNTVFTDLPPSGSGIIYNAAIKVGYGSVYIDAQVTVVAALVVTGGSISGPLYVGQQLTYTPGTPSAGAPPYGTPTYQWFADGLPIGSATSTTFTLTGAQLNKQITASTTYTDNASQTATGTSAAVGPVLANPGALTITSPGSIAPTGNPAIGVQLNYTAGTFTGGIPTVTPSWKWQRNGTDISGVPANSTSYTTVSADSGQLITVRYQVQDSSTPTPAIQSASTPSVTPYNPIPNWNPGSAMNSSVPGTSSATWNNPTGTVTSTGCVVLSLTGAPGSWSQSVTATNGQPLYIQWNMAAPGTCGLAPSGTTIQGTVTGASGQNSYSVVVNRKPTAFGFAPGTTSAPLGSVQASTPSVSITGINTTAYITLGSLSAGATNLEARVNGGTWTPVPSAPSTALPIDDTNSLEVRFTTGSGVGATYTAVVNIGDGDTTQFTASSPGFVVVNTTSAVFPGVTFTPAGGPNAANETVSNVTGGGFLGTLNGVANSNGWPAGLGTTLSSPVSGATPTMKFRKGGSGVYVTSGLSINSGETLNLAWNEAYLATVADGGSATGTFTGTVGANTYTNTFTMSVKRDAVWSIGTPVTNVALNSSQSTSLLLPNDYNVPVTVTFNNPTLGTSPLPMITGTISYAIDSNPTVLVTLGTTTATLNPGETLQVFGDVGGANNQTYGIKIKIGTSAAQDWLVTTTAATPSVKTPIIGPPSNNATGVGTSSGLTINADTYTPLNGAGTHASSNWELYSGSYPLTSTNNISTVAQNTPTWTNQGLSGLSSVYVYNSTYVNGKFFITGQSTPIFSSSTGSGGWSSVPNPIGGVTNSVGPIAYGNGLYFASGWNGLNASILTSSSGTSWNVAQFPAVTNPNSGSGAYGNSTYVVSIGNDIYTSTNGTAWNSLGLSNTPFLTYANSLFVAVGFSGNIRTSPDGTNWTSRTSGVTSTLNAVTYGNGLFVVVGNSGVVLTSPDGTTWTPRTSGTTNTLSQVTYGNGLFVAVSSGGAGSIFTSLDGITWAQQPAGGVTATLFGISFGNGLFVGAGYDTGATSGQVWTTSSPTSSTTLTITNCAADGFLVGDTVVSLPSGAGPATITAVDNSNVTVVPSSALWTTQKITRATSMYTQVVPPPANPNSSNLESITVAAPPLLANTTYYVRVQYTSSLSITSNWSNWSKFTTGSLLPANGSTLLSTVGTGSTGHVAWDGVSIYAVSGGSSFGNVRYSSDLINWNTSTIASVNSCNGTFWTGSKFITILFGTSSPGQMPGTASTVNPAGGWTAGTVSSREWGNTLDGFVLKSSTDMLASCVNTFGKSTDASYFTTYAQAASPGQVVPGVQGATLGIGTYFNSLYLWAFQNSFGGQIKLIYSSTGAPGSWTDAGQYDAVNRVRWITNSPTSAIAVGQAGIRRSADGMVWTNVLSSGVFNSVAYNSGVYMAVGDNGLFYVSVDDGLTWLDRTTSVGITETIRGINYVGGKWIANTGNGKIYQIT